jgi:hypothetical protein
MTGAVLYTLYLWRKMPERSCGCFGKSSGEGTTWRNVARAGILLGATIACMFAQEPWWNASTLSVAFLVAESTTLVMLSPEKSAIFQWFNEVWSVGCHQASSTEEQGLRALARSRVWRALMPEPLAALPEDSWREACWRFFVYPISDSRDTKRAVFAVQKRLLLPPRVMGSVVDEERELVLQTNWAGLGPPTVTGGTAGDE